MTVERAMILAGGKATRLGELAADRPKPMLPVAGRPLLEHTVRQLAAAGVREAGVNLHQHPQAVVRHFGDGSSFGLRLSYNVEAEPLGTAGALRAFRPLLERGPFLVMYGDNLTTCDFGRLAADHAEHGGCATIALFWRDDVTRHSAVEIQPDRRITRFVEKPKAEEAPSQWISAGVLVLEPRVLDFVGQSGFCDFGFHVFPALLAAGERLYGYLMGPREGLWWIDTPEDYRRVGERFAGGFP